MIAINPLWLAKQVATIQRPVSPGQRMELCVTRDDWDKLSVHEEFKFVTLVASEKLEWELLL